tara:strand:- start:7254 stop:8237 length:984 start_codon:yes stop_codon:yes gene_type:complete
MRGIMTKSSVLDQEKFWTIVRYLVELESDKSFEDICLELTLTKKQLHSFINFLKEVDCHLETYQKESKKFLSPAKELPQIEMNFTLLEWLQFQAHFPAITSMHAKPFHEDVKKKLIDVEQEYANHDLFSPLETFSKLYSEKHLSLVGKAGLTDSVVEKVEQALVDHKALIVQVEQKTMEIYPRKIVYFDGDFNLIGESLEDQSLLNIKIESVSEISLRKIQWKPRFSKFEINEFVSSLRQMNENSVRLVLKIYDHQNFNLNLKYQFFENPCVFTNSHGEYIWAATIEPNKKIFQWLYELGSDVEILDPKEFKLEFLRYCETKVNKLA